MHIAITGASSGIGAALAREYGAAGNKLSLVARRTDLLAALADEVAADAHVYAADLCSLATACDWIADAESASGPIEILINNAGMQYVEPFFAISSERAERLYNLNLLAPLRLIRAVAPGMVERGSGAIVNVASVAAITFASGMADYSASKAGLAAASESLNEELAGKGVHVLTVYPGPVHTAMEAAARAKFAGNRAAEGLPTGTTDEIASLIAAFVQKRRPRLVYPRIYGVTRHARDISQWVTRTFGPHIDDVAAAAEKP